MYCNGVPAGCLEEVSKGFRFAYYSSYLVEPGTKSISLTLPKRVEPFFSRVLFPFFYGLLAEGALKDMQCRKLRLDEQDHFGRLLKTTECDAIGAVTVVEEEAG